jgi:hypothetical protein
VVGRDGGVMLCLDAALYNALRLAGTSGEQADTGESGKSAYQPGRITVPNAEA